MSTFGLGLGGLGLTRRTGATGAAPLTGDGFIGANFSGLEYAFIADDEGPSEATVTYAKDDVGVTLARINVAHEALQPTLGGNLDQDQVDRVLALGAICHAKGMAWYLDNHNSARYDPSYGNTEGHDNPGQHEDSYVLGSTDYSIAQFAGFIGKETTAFKDAPGCIGVGISNEPHDLVEVNLAGSSSNNFTGTGWTKTDPGVVLTANAAANPFATANDAWTMNNGPGSAGIEFAFTPPAGAKAFAIWIRQASGTSDYYWQKDGSGIIGGGAGVHTADSTWRQVQTLFTATGATHTLTLFSDGAAGTVLQIYGMQVNEGSTLLDLGENVTKSTWQIAIQAAADAIDAIDDEFGMFVCGENFSTMAGWMTNSSTLRCSRSGSGAVWWTPHDYPGDATGNYTGDTHSGLAATIAAHAATRDTMIAHFETNSLRFIVDEMQVPGTNDDAALWNADLADAIDQYQDSPNCDGIVIWNIGAKETGYPSFFNNPDVANSTLMSPADADQSRAVVWRSKAKAGPFAE